MEGIYCPKCKKVMRKIHNYMSENDKKLNVYYCCDCDYILILDDKVKTVEWVK